MIRIGLISIALAFVITSCNGQMKKQGNENKPDQNSPQTSIRVNKQYDKNGNIVRYDSTYSDYYSNIKGDTLLRDSILNNFKKTFNQKYFYSNDPFFKDFFFNDSLLKYDFYKKDFFEKRFQNNMSQLDSLFHSMDSLKNSFFEKQFKRPGQLIVPKGHTGS